MSYLLSVDEKNGTCDRCGKTKTGLRHNNRGNKTVYLCITCRAEWTKIWNTIYHLRGDEPKRLAFEEFMRNKTREKVQFT